MRLSLSILADWLKKYNPTCSIASGERTIRNVRMFSDEHRFTDNNVYISRTGGDSGWVILMHKNDYVLLSTEDENQVMNEIMDAFDFYNDWSDSVNQQLRSLTPEQILLRSSGVLGVNLMIADASYSIIASYCPPGQEDPVIETIVGQGIMDIEQIMNVELDARIREHRRRCYMQETGGFHLQACVRNLFTGGNHWGWLISAAENHTQGQMHIQEELGDILEQWMLFHQEDQSQRELSGVFLNLLDGTYASRDSVLFQLRLMGWRDQEEKWVYVLTNPEKSLALLHKVDRINIGVRAWIYEKRVVALFRGSVLEQKRFHDQLSRLLLQSDCRCGISPGFTDIFLLKEYFRLACAAPEHSEEILCPFENIALEHGLELMKQQTTPWMIHPALEVLLHYDIQNHTCLYDTLRCYLKQERSVAQTANEMNLHRNTLLYRINRIQEITELNLDDPKLRLHLQLSFCLNEIR